MDDLMNASSGSPALLSVAGQVVEVGADRAGGACSGERMAAATAGGAGEERLAVVGVAGRLALRAARRSAARVRGRRRGGCRGRRRDRAARERRRRERQRSQADARCAARRRAREDDHDDHHDHTPIVPMSPAARTLIMAARTISGGAARAKYRKQGIRRAASNAEPNTTMLDKRDIQTLMYCIRVAETAGQWQHGLPGAIAQRTRVQARRADARDRGGHAIRAAA